ncbi:MAG: hypothetical protein IKC27_08125, partial [Kiritimatiellae bacterium]|nr:hypothetical protein [Kiritimatiellia bacterium]
VTLLLRLSGEVSQASIRRVPSPRERCRETAPAREICFITAALAFIPAPLRLLIIPQNQVFRQETFWLEYPHLLILIQKINRFSRFSTLSRHLKIIASC